MTLQNDVLEFGMIPDSTIWRASKRRYDPMRIPPIEFQGTNRFDGGGPSRHHEPTFGVLYCGESQYASFVEVLAPLREQAQTTGEVLNTTIMDVDERERSSEIDARVHEAVFDRWLTEWVLTSADVRYVAPVFDLVRPQAVQFLREQLSLLLMTLKIPDLDFSSVLSDNRQLTQAISRWVWSLESENQQPLFSGIRYRSRFDPECTCLALYQDRYDVDGAINIQPITPETPGFAEAAKTLRLKIS